MGCTLIPHTLVLVKLNIESTPAKDYMTEKSIHRFGRPRPNIRRDTLSTALRKVRQTFVGRYQTLGTHNGCNVLCALWTVTGLRVELISALQAAGDLDGDKTAQERQRWGNNSTIQWLSDAGATAKPSPQIALFICTNTKRGLTARASHAHLPPSATAQLGSDEREEREINECNCWQMTRRTMEQSVKWWGPEPEEVRCCMFATGLQIPAHLLWDTNTNIYIFLLQNWYRI